MCATTSLENEATRRKTRGKSFRVGLLSIFYARMQVLLVFCVVGFFALVRLTMLLILSAAFHFSVASVIKNFFSHGLIARWKTCQPIMPLLNAIKHLIANRSPR